MKYEIRATRGHYEIFDCFGNFLCSADSYKEALEDVKSFSFTD